MNNSTKISALAITFNEAEQIEGFIKSLWFADEIIIVDSHSTDETVEIASKFENVKIVFRDFDNFSSQKNFAISQAKNDWILFFDPDEFISEALAKEIISTLQKPNAIAYYIKRELYFMGKPIKFSGFQTDWVIRLFNKNFCKYNKNKVHELIETNGVTAKLKNKVAHHSYKGIDNYTGKLHNYSKLQAEMLFEKEVRPNAYHFLFRPFYRFWHQYLLRLGILDGKEGFILAYINAFSVFKRYVNLWLLYRKIN